MSDTAPEGPGAAGPGSPQDAAAPAGATAAAPPASAAVDRLSRFTAANMLRSLLPLTLIILAVVGWASLRQDHVDPVTRVETASTVRLAADAASYPLEVPAGLPDSWVATSARTDAAAGGRAGAPVTLEIGYYTPGQQFAGFVIGNDERASALSTVLDGATDQGPVTIAGRSWEQIRTQRGETAYTRPSGDATIAVTGSASDRELQTLAASIQPYRTP